MKTIIERIRTAASLAVLLALGFVSTGWAGLVAEWNGDFDVTQKNGWTLTVGTGNTFANGVITIGASSTNPVLISNSNGGEAVTLVVGIKTSSSDTAGTVAHCAYETGGKGVYSYLNVSGESTSKVQYGWFDGSTWKDGWNAGGNVTWSSDSIQYVTLVALTDTDSPHNTNADPRGTTIYHNGTLVGSRQDGLRASNTAMTYLGVGGNVGRNSSNGMLNGAVISYIAIYDDALYGSTMPTAAQASVPTNLNLMYLISGNTIGTSGGVALANDAGYGDVVPTVWHSGYRNYASGKYGNASKLNGGTLGFIKNDGDGLGLNTSEGFTISFWANLASDLGNWRDFLAFRVGNVNCRFEKMDSNAFAMYSSGGTPFQNVAYTVNTWSHYAVVFAPNNGGLKVYKDGTEVVSVTESVPSGTLYQIGMGQGRNGSDADSAFRTNDSPGNSLIDDLAIFKGALSASQISAIATSESAISGPVYGMYRTVSFATPQESVWATANLPNFAKTVTYGSGTVSFANDAYSKSTVNGKAARLTSIVGGSFTEIDGYVKYQQTADTTSDVYLRVAGDTTATRVNGVGESDYSKGTRTFNGNVLLNLTGSAVVDHVMGAGYKGGDPTALTGDVGVVIDGNAVVEGTVLGGWSSVHNYKPKIDGSTYVLVKNVQGTGGATAEGSIPNGYIMGGSSYQGNYGRSWITQHTSVAIDLPNDATGSFVKGIVGGSYGNHASQATEIGGSSSVTITAPNAVTFSGNIIGGCWANLGTASVGGNSSVTLNGGTYTGTIYAGGYGNGAPTVTGNATLTLNGGVYSGATLLAGAASGTKSLVITGNVDLSNTTIADSGFGVLSVAGDKTLTLGTKRLTGNNDPILSSSSEGVIALTLTEEEYTSKYAELLKCEASDVSGQYVIYYNDTDITSEIASKVNVLAGKLTYLDSSSYESTIAAQTSMAWDEVTWTKVDSTVDTMANVAASSTANATLLLNGTLVISSPVTFAGEALEITGSGTIRFTDSATLTAAISLNIGTGITLDFAGLTNLTNMGIDTIISAGNDVSIGTSSVSYPAGWACHTITSSDSMRIIGACFASDTISVNIIGGTLYEGTTWYTGSSIADSNTAGYLPILGTKWNQTVHASKPADSSVDVQTDALKEVRSDNSVVTSAGVTMTIKASGPYADFWSGVSRDNEDGNSQLMYGYLDDGEVSDGKGAKIVVNNIPYSEYAVLVYMGTDQKSGSFGCVYVNGTGYYGANGLTVEGTSAWGSYASTHGSITLGEGSNYLRIAGLTGSSVTIQGSKNANGNRCGISGVQIVNTGLRGATYSATLEGSDATFLPSGTSTGMTKTSTETWINNGEGKIYLTNPSDATSTVTIGENVSVKVFKIMGAGKVTLAIGAGSALSISGGKIDLSEFSGTLCVDSTVSQTFFEDVSTNGGTVRFLGTGLSFAGAASLPRGRVAFKSATLTDDLQLNNRTLVVEDGDSVILNGNNNSRTSMQFVISGGSLTVKGGNFWFGNGSTFTQTGGTVTLESTSTSMSDSGCVIFGFSSGGGTVNISGGTFDMSGATLCLWTGTTSLTLSGNAVFKVKGIWSNASKNVTVGGSSKLILTGTQGISNNLGSLTMNGGTIEFQESATIAKALTLTSGVESTINIADTKSATISTVALSTVPAVGDKILATNGGTITVSAITAGGVAQELDLSYWSDGVYVAAAEYDSVNYPSVSAAIAVATDANLADITLLNDCTTVPEGYYISEGSVVKCQAAVVDTDGVAHYYATAQDAVDHIGDYYLSPLYNYFAVYSGENVAINLNMATWQYLTFKIKCFNSSSVVVTPNSAEYEFVAGEPDVNGVVTYTKTEKATTYVWAGTGDSALAWGNNNYWKVGTSDGDGASRAPGANDTVIINGGAPISISGVTVTAMHIGGEASIRGSGTLKATTGGIVLTDAAATLTVTGVTLSPRPTTTVENSYVKLTDSTYSVDAYNVITINAPNATVTRMDALGTAIKDGDTITFMVVADSGYAVARVTASSGNVAENEGVYSYVVNGDATITVATTAALTIGDVTFDYLATYRGAKTVTATVTGEVPAEGATWTLSIGSENYTGEYDNGTVTFNNVTGLTPGGSVDYTITAGGTASGTKSDSTVAATPVESGWVNETKTTIGTASATGTWSPSAPVFGEADSAALSGETTFTANSQASGKVTLTTVVNFGNEAAPTIEIGADAKAAIKVENNSFKIWTKTTVAGEKGASADWLTVSGATPYLAADSTVVFTFDTDAKTFTVSVGGNALYYGASNANTSFAFASDGVAISSVAYKGAGSFTSLTGEYTTTDIAQTVDGKGVVVANSFISGNAALRAMTIEEAAAALAPDATATCSNGYNYFANYALGLDPTKAEDKPIVDVTVDDDGNYKVTLKHADGTEITAADNVALTVKLNYGTTAAATKFSTESVAIGESITLTPSEMFNNVDGNVLYYKAEVSIGAK